VDLGLQVAQGLRVRGVISLGAGLIFHGLVGAHRQRAQRLGQVFCVRAARPQRASTSRIGIRGTHGSGHSFSEQLGLGHGSTSMCVDFCSVIASAEPFFSTTAAWLGFKAPAILSNEPHDAS
jgi:hypothetical protein